MADPNDLVSLDRAMAVFPEGGLTPAQQATIPALITAASKAITRFCRRPFQMASYDEIRVPRAGQWDRGEPDYVPLRYWPVQTITRVAAGKTPTIAITNTDRATNQRATVAPILTGDVESQQSCTGLTFTTVASAVTTTAPLTFAAYPTIAGLADAINALGDGWQATVPPNAPSNLGLWPTTELAAPDGPTGARGRDVTLCIFAEDLAGYKLDTATGGLYLPAATMTGIGPGDPWMWPGTAGIDYLVGSWRSEVRVTYTAGWNTVPESVQQACAVTVQQLYYDQVIPNMFSSESMGEYSYQVNEPNVSIPASARDLLGPYVAYRF